MSKNDIIIEMKPTCALIGCVSAGKSTFMNSLFANSYSDTKIRRTTMIPQVYIQSNKNKTNTDSLIKKNRDINNEFLNGKKELTDQTCQEIIHYVDPLFDFLEVSENFNLKIYDIPGLNDSKSKTIYYNWISKNFYKFDIIFYVVDVQSSMNTSDERDIIKMIIQNIKKEQTRGHEVKLNVILNKCDDININDNDEIELDDEHCELLDQVKNIVNEEFKNNQLESYHWILSPLSSRDSFTCRTLQKNPTMNIDKQIRNKIGLEYIGKIKWKSMTETQKDREIGKIVTSKSFEEKLKECGFYQFRKNINTNYLDYKSVMLFLLNKFKLLLGKFDKIEIDYTVLSDQNINTNISWQNGFVDHVNIFSDIIRLIEDEYSNKSVDGLINDFYKYIVEFIDKKLDQWINNTLPSRNSGSNNYTPEVFSDEKTFNKKQIIKETINYFNSELPDYYNMNAKVWLNALCEEQNDYLINQFNSQFSDTINVLNLEKSLQRLKNNSCDKKYYLKIINKFIDNCDKSKYYLEKTSSNHSQSLDTKNIKELIDLINDLPNKYQLSKQDIINFTQKIFNSQIEYYLDNLSLRSLAIILYSSIITQIENIFIMDKNIIFTNLQLRKFLLNLKNKINLSLMLLNNDKCLIKEVNNIDLVKEGENLIIFNYLYQLIK